MAEDFDALARAIDANAEALAAHEAGLQAHEFLLETLYGLLWASAPDREIEAAKRQILELTATAHYAGREPRDDHLQLRQNVRAMAERFLERASRRASEIREARDETGSPE